MTIQIRPAHHNLNNQQLKRFGHLCAVQMAQPAHHNLNNQQLKPEGRSGVRNGLTSTS
ncbi:hypothetical protein [uncultured Gammaproteobacteria bacterium]|nr:hypothetical protein [uncultured Gammaproteobacteria bacterium]